MEITTTRRVRNLSFAPSDPAAAAMLLRVQYTDIKVGNGPEAVAGKGVVANWVMRRSNGYYVSASAEGGGEPFIYRVCVHRHLSLRCHYHLG